ncbi:hypothetical protein P9D43_28285 [Neobacillus niacini]|uniref:hypothetical protein n=1 Tax=Neobacillus niacini TaxID=86668 RepID=UPI00052F810C|nr:hypothetical protein [Neobacillus niacini]KGM45737.1 hypothetical protein NP83_04315 [Neobacillus niacini]MEC1525901.1 hypothetical protein [Neobacillus niacini]
MIENFFADYKKFVVIPEDESQVNNEVFDPKKYAGYYILTLSIFDSRLSTWRDASKFEIDIEKSIKTVLRNINQMQREKYHFQLLEIDKFKNYFILALSTKTRFNPGEEDDRIAYVIDRILTNPFYVGQNWFKLIGEKGRVARKLFCYSFKEYIAADLNQSKREDKYENISELIPKNGEIKLIKSAQKMEVL